MSMDTDDLVVIAGPDHIEPVIELRINFTDGTAGLFIQGTPELEDIILANRMVKNEYGYELAFISGEAGTLEDTVEYTVFLLKEVK